MNKQACAYEGQRRTANGNGNSGVLCAERQELFYYQEPYALSKLFGATAKWVDSREEDDSISGLYYKDTKVYTVIGSCEKGASCSFSKTIYQFLTNEELEMDVLTKIRQKEAAQNKDQKTDAARLGVKAVAIGGATLVKAAMGSHRAGNTATAIDKAVDNMFGIDHHALEFDEAKYRKCFVKLAGKQVWADCSYLFECFDLEQWGKKRMVFRGVPDQYKGNRNKKCCISCRIDKGDYYIYEYIDIQTTQKVWEQLEQYGFTKTW